MEESEAETLKIEGLEFPRTVTTTSASRPLKLIAHGITDVEIHFLQVKFTAIGVYFGDEVESYLQAWKVKASSQIMADDSFFETLIHVPVGKLIRVVVIKEIKGAQYALQLETAIRDRLAAAEKYEEEEEEVLQKVVDFFVGKYLKTNSVITYNFPESFSKPVEVKVVCEGKEAKLAFENENVAETMAKWYLGGASAVSPSTIVSLSQEMAALINK
eukprot:TRINITY_DN1131_c0_g1_i1.p1 TRINITY_DN1131_c0_g1~~TRINITY_DN1131_c0_g1_i1.p1  ORF type:complete len:216 (-),score=38.64 TRINITY_DN1131_c0_g1_i1:255-902(-)